jgi:hypothetical protein
MGRAFMIKYGNGLVWYIWEESGVLLGRVGIYRRVWIISFGTWYGHIHNISNDAQKHQN